MLIGEDNVKMSEDISIFHDVISQHYIFNNKSINKYCFVSLLGNTFHYGLGLNRSQQVQLVFSLIFQDISDQYIVKEFSYC